MIVLSGADLLLPDRILSAGTLTIEDGRIAAIASRGIDDAGSGSVRVRLDDHYIAPGFIDVHVHGVEGRDTLDGGAAVAEIAKRLPRYGVTAFCPTTVACGPGPLREVLTAIRSVRRDPPNGARVLPAHLESNFINPAYRGAQPAGCLRPPPGASATGSASVTTGPVVANDRDGPGDHRDRREPGGSVAQDRDRDTAGVARVGADADAFTSDDIMAEILLARPDVGIVTLAPELPGGIDLVTRLVALGLRVSLGHSAASYEEALAAIAAGARHATHLFNRMPPLAHRSPGLAGAVLASEDMAAEIICDGYHVHPAMVRVAIGAKQPSRIMAISDGTAGSGLPVGSRARLGGQPITVGDSAAHLDDGTLAGSVLTMDGAFRTLVGAVGLSPVDAAIVCATTPARELGLSGHGVLATGAVADLVVLNRRFEVVQTYVAGTLAFTRI